MKRKANQTYSKPFKAKVVAYWREHGPCATAREFGLSRSTVNRWVRASGLDASQASKDRVAAAAEGYETKRALLKAKLIDKALDLLDRMDKPHVDFKGSGTKVKYPKPTAQACQQYATSVGILIDKFRLESGESTSREEIVTPDAAEREIARLERQLGLTPDAHAD